MTVREVEVVRARKALDLLQSDEPEQRPGAWGRGWRDCALFLAGDLNERIAEHFWRLRAETACLLDVYPVINPSRFPSPICSIFNRPAKELLRERWAEMLNNGGMIPGYVDLLWLPIALSALANEFPYRNVWIIEYDVDFSGQWRQFFEQFRFDDADVLTTTLVKWEDAPDWYFRSLVGAPDAVSPASWHRSFHPIGRFSRRFLNAYIDQMNGPGWRGHHEFTIPTIGFHLGMTVSDIGGFGRNYTNNPSVADLSPGTLVWRPFRTSYFHEEPETFEVRGMLYHPIKPEKSREEPSPGGIDAQV